MEYNIVELIISCLFWFLIGFVISKIRHKNAWREVLYRANPELRPAMAFTINDKLEILWYRYETRGITVLATVVTEENQQLLTDWYDIWPDIGDYVVQDDGNHFAVAPLSFLRDHKRLITS